MEIYLNIIVHHCHHSLHLTYVYYKKKKKLGSTVFVMSVCLIDRLSDQLVISEITEARMLKKCYQ